MSTLSKRYLSERERERDFMIRVLTIMVIEDHYERRRALHTYHQRYLQANRAIGDRIRPLCDTWMKRVGKGLFSIKVDIAEWIVGKRIDSIDEKGFLVHARVHINDVERLEWSTMALHFRAARSADGKHVVVTSARRRNHALAHKNKG